MLNVILVAHILVSIVLVIVVLMQRSEGGALGIGGGGGGGAGGGMMTAGGVKGALVRTTIIFGAIFFISSLGLTTLATQRDSGGVTDIERNLDEEFGTQPEEDILAIDALETLDDLRGADVDLSVDPLATPSTPAVTAPAEETTPDEPANDPLADPLADPQ